jgi:hypothetical protein
MINDFTQAFTGNIMSLPQTSLDMAKSHHCRAAGAGIFRL